MNIPVLLTIFFVFFFILFVWTIWIKKVAKSVKKEKKRLVEELYPDLTAADKNYRKTSINNYFNSYFKNLSKFYLAIPYITVIVMILTIICIIHINSWGMWGLFLCLSILMILSSLYFWLTPSLEKQKAFWEDYLKKNPDNPLKVVLFPIEKSNQAVKIDNLRALYFFSGAYIRSSWLSQCSLVDIV